MKHARARVQVFSFLWFVSESTELVLIELGIDVLHLNHLGLYWSNIHSPLHKAQWNQNIRPPHASLQNTIHRIAVSVLHDS